MLVYLWQRLFFYILTSLDPIIRFVDDFALDRKLNFVEFIREYAFEKSTKILQYYFRFLNEFC